MIFRKRILKFLTFLVFILVFIALGGYYYLKSTWGNFMTKNELTEFVTKVKFAEPLPDRFYELYEEEYPNVLSKNLNNQILKGVFSNNFIKSPSLIASIISDHSRKREDSLRVSNRKAYTLAWKLEEETTQKECLNWAVHNYKFHLAIHGIKEVAAFYYRKEVSELDEKELRGVITLMKNPSLTEIIKPENQQLME